MKRIIIVNGKAHTVPASLVLKVQNMVEHGKTDMEIAYSIGRTRAYAHALKMSILDQAQEKVA